MSWIVESLIKDRWKIKENPDINSDSYNNILIIEKAVKELLSNKLLTSLEVQILNIISEGYTLSDAEKTLGISRQTISKLFIATCVKIACYLGGEFTDEGLIEYMERQYNLNNTQIEKLKKFMKSMLKHKIVRTDKMETIPNE